MKQAPSLSVVVILALVLGARPIEAQVPYQCGLDYSALLRAVCRGLERAVVVFAPPRIIGPLADGVEMVCSVGRQLGLFPLEEGFGETWFPDGSFPPRKRALLNSRSLGSDHDQVEFLGRDPAGLQPPQVNHQLPADGHHGFFL